MSSVLFSRQSTDSDRSRSPSPRLYAVDSSSQLVLVHDEDEDEDELDNLRPGGNTPFEFTTDDEDDGNAEDLHNTPFSSLPSRNAAEPLSQGAVCLYLLAPCLKLGAMLLPNTELPLKYGLPALIMFSILSALSRQLWYMLARYLCTVDFNKVVLDALAKGRRKERRRAILRSIITVGTLTLRVLLSTIYLRECVHHLAPLLTVSISIPAEPVLAIALTLLIIPFTLAKSLGSKRVLACTFLSAVTYIAWLSCVSYTYSKGLLVVNPSWLRMGTLWQGITTIAFAFTSSSTLQLYASLKAKLHKHQTSTVKTPKTRSFRTISFVSILVALILTIPLIVFAAKPNNPLAQGNADPSLEAVISVLFSATLLLGIPSMLVTTPILSRPRNISIYKLNVISKATIHSVMLLFCILPSSVYYVICDLALGIILSSTYFLPTLLHIATHFLRRPLSIIMPTTPNPFTPATRDHNMPSSSNDPLLQRKERAMRKKQLKRRIAWDIGVWIVLLPLCISGTIWVVGRLGQQW